MENVVIWKKIFCIHRFCTSCGHQEQYFYVRIGPVCLL